MMPFYQIVDVNILIRQQSKYQITTYYYCIAYAFLFAVGRTHLYTLDKCKAVGNLARVHGLPVAQEE